MDKRSTYNKYASRIDTEPQSVYLESGSAYKLVDELRKLGTRRILFICAKGMSKYKNIEKLVDFYESQRFRVFTYYRPDGTPTDIDIQAGLKIYKEYNCDTIMVAGGNDDVNSAKMIAAAAINPVKNLREFAGIGKLKRDISVLCCIVTDNGDMASSSIAEYCDSSTGKWITCMSAYLIPQIICYDTDFSVRTDADVLQTSALMSLMSAIEAYLSTLADDKPKYKANAVNSCLNIMNHIDSMLKNTSDTYTRRICAIGGMYAGLAMRKTGLGQAHILARYLASRYKTGYGVGINIMFPLFLRYQIRTSTDNIASLAKNLHLCTASLDSLSAASIFVDRIDMLFSRMPATGQFPQISENEAKKIASIVEKESMIYGSTGVLSAEDIAHIIVESTAQ